MQRYPLDRDRDDDWYRGERGSQARNEDRFSQRQFRDTRGEFGGRREGDLERGSYEDGANPGPNRWRELGGERDRFDRSYGRGRQGGDYYTGDALDRGRDDEDYRRSWNEYGNREAWPPSRQSMRDPRRWQYGETEYGVYGPRYGSSYSGGSIHGTGHGTYGGPQYGSYGDERGDDRYSRQGYGQSRWQREYEQEQHRFDPDYEQWRAEQIRNLDEDYRRYRQERYRKFSEEFDSWRKNRESARSMSGTTQDPGSKDLNGMSRDSLGAPKTNR